MEVALLSSKSIRLKGKKVTMVVDPAEKTQGDVVLLLSSDGKNASSLVEGAQIVGQGAGEYEIGGTKFSVYSTNGEYVYDINFDGLKVFLANSKALETLSDKFVDKDILVLLAEGETNMAAITQLTPRVVVLYGPSSDDVAKKIGKEEVSSAKKYQTAAEKLPAEMEVVILK